MFRILWRDVNLYILERVRDGTLSCAVADKLRVITDAPEAEKIQFQRWSHDVNILAHEQREVVSFFDDPYKWCVDTSSLQGWRTGSFPTKVLVKGSRKLKHRRDWGVRFQSGRRLAPEPTSRY